MRKSSHHHIQIFEHQTLRIGDVKEGVVFTAHHWEQLLRLNETQYPPYFQIIHQGIRALHYVGVIALDHLTIEILPKTSQQGSAQAQLLLLDMLKTTGRLPSMHLPSSLAQGKGKLFDLFLLQFIKEVEALAAKGMVKHYRKEQKNEHKFSGRILFSEQIRKNCVHKEKVYAEHQVFDTQHLLNDYIKEALEKVLSLTSNQEIISKTQKLLAYFPSSTSSIDIQKINRIKLSRNEVHYEKAIQWARMILFELKPKVSFGDLRCHCFLINMQQLFEEYVNKKLCELAPSYGCKIKSQTLSKFWRRRSIRPDMLLTTANGENIILDTKWKLLKNNEPEDADLKQIYIYNRFFNAHRGILLYPLQNKSVGYSANFQHWEESSMSCEIAYVDLFGTNDRLSPMWPNELLEQILNKKLTKAQNI
ncbi:hypothetical protein WJR50_18100 [Catalinimonas sp. 4WD22]|uniref:McrC family protein n=1 Tax=Catalinimonas locisalis TaxID=3133978 RepID=UPI00310114D8